MCQTSNSMQFNVEGNRMPNNLISKLIFSDWWGSGIFSFSNCYPHSIVFQEQKKQITTTVIKCSQKQPENLCRKFELRTMNMFLNGIDLCICWKAVLSFSDQLQSPSAHVCSGQVPGSSCQPLCPASSHEPTDNW